MLRSSDLEVQAASQQRALRDVEKRAKDKEVESGTLQAELVQQRRIAAIATEAEEMQASELRENAAGEARAMEDAVTRERVAGGRRLQASEEQMVKLRAELAQHQVAAAAKEHDTVSHSADIMKLELQVATQQKTIREGQHELDAFESTSSLLKEQSQQEHQAYKAAQEREVVAALHITELESELGQARSAIRDAVHLAKQNTKQRMKSAESKRKDLQLQLECHRDAESQLAQQECELRELLVLAKLQSQEELQACESRNNDLQTELAQQRERTLACEAESAELEDLLAKQKEATAIEASAMESVSEMAQDLAKQRDEEKAVCEDRIKKLKARIRELEMMLEISKEFLSRDHSATASDASASILSIQQAPPSLPDDLWASKSNRPKMLRAALRSSHSAGSLHPNSKPINHVLRGAGFNWPGRHLGPDEDGPVKVTFEESEES
jgi:hypothetical protein